MPRGLLSEGIGEELAAGLLTPTGKLLGLFEEVIRDRNRGLHTRSMTAPSTQAFTVDTRAQSGS
jgi:hypothetical protein